jgi:hypothetical protein
MIFSSCSCINVRRWYTELQTPTLGWLQDHLKGWGVSWSARPTLTVAALVRPNWSYLTGVWWRLQYEWDLSGTEWRIPLRTCLVIPILCGLECIGMDCDVFWLAMDLNRLNTANGLTVKRARPKYCSTSPFYTPMKWLLTCILPADPICHWTNYPCPVLALKSYNIRGVCTNAMIHVEWPFGAWPRVRTYVLMVFSMVSRTFY